MDYVPLKEAAKKHNIDEQVLTQLISAGMINAKKVSGEILVAVDNNGNGDPQTKEEIISAEFAHLQGHLITISQAARKYELNRDTILKWVKKKYIKIIEPGYRMKIDEADAAYCASVYQQKLIEYGGDLEGVTIFDENGNPYKVIHPSLSKRRRSIN